MLRVLVGFLLELIVEYNVLTSSIVELRRYADGGPVLGGKGEVGFPHRDKGQQRAALRCVECRLNSVESEEEGEQNVRRVVHVVCVVVVAVEDRLRAL